MGKNSFLNRLRHILNVIELIEIIIKNLLKIYYTDVSDEGEGGRVFSAF